MTYTCPGESFVDVTTIGTTGDNHHIKPIPSSVSEFTQEEEGIVTRMEEIIQFFLDLLQVTGGNLAPEKCTWYLIGYRWSKRVPKLIQIEPQHRSIYITLRASAHISGIQRKAPMEGHRTLFF
jgi:hypothetical protein